MEKWCLHIYEIHDFSELLKNSVSCLEIPFLMAIPLYFSERLRKERVNKKKLGACVG